MEFTPLVGVESTQHFGVHSNALRFFVEDRRLVFKLRRFEKRNCAEGFVDFTPLWVVRECAF